MKKYILIITLAFVVILDIYAQTKEVNILSPKAASIMKYGEYPVSLYTGLVDITIPVYTIERSGIKVPIEFKYHASGIKYDDISNEVGLGWSLIAGGMVTRMVKGYLGDGTYTKDITKIKVCDSDPSPFDNDYLALREVENGNRGRLSRDNSIGVRDGEIDMYSFSFLNQSGTFCFPPLLSEVNGLAPSTGLFIPNNGMKVIDRSSPNLKFDLLDTEGVFYRFEVKDVDQNERYKEYYLTKIISANKADTISFSYDVISASSYYQRRPYINYSATLTTISSLDSDTPLSPGNITSESGGISMQELRPPRLTRIDFSGGHIDFEYVITNGITTWDLKEVRVYNNVQLLPIQTVTLVKSSFSNGEKRLEKVIFSDSQAQNYDYQFGYNGEPGYIKPDNSTSYKGIDYWGYYNGQNVPYGKKFIPKFNNMPSGIEGTDRNANESYMQNGILNKIIYPTKGFSEFTYEAHKASYSTEGTNMQTFGGLRIKEIKNYLPTGTLAERKWYKYGYKESGVGTANAFPDIKDFTTTSRVLITYENGAIAQHLCQVKDITSYSSFPRTNYFISGSSVVYPVVTEYIGNDTEDYGKTVYNYDVILDEKLNQYGETYRWDSPDICQRSYPWKTGQLLSKQVYKKEGDTYKEVYSLQNTYKDINVSEYRNVRVLPFIEFEYILYSNAPDIKKNFCNILYENYSRHFGSKTPYDYFNYYTTTGLRVLSSSKEVQDGVTGYTYYDVYNANGLPTKVRRTSSTGEDFTTIYKYSTDFTSSVYAGMQSSNILTPVIEDTYYNKKNQLLKRQLSNYKIWYSRFYAIENTQYQSEGGALETRSKYNYSENSKIQEASKDDSDKVTYLWGYNNQYPIAEIRNAVYTDVVPSKISEATVKAIASKNEPSTSDWSLIEGLRTSLPNAFITTFKYKPLIGLVWQKDARAMIREYTYDDFGRLKETYLVNDNGRNILEENLYHYSNGEVNTSELTVKIVPDNTNIIKYNNTVSFKAVSYPALSKYITLKWTATDGNGQVLAEGNDIDFSLTLLSEKIDIVCEITNSITNTTYSDKVSYQNIEIPKCGFENIIYGKDGDYNTKEATLSFPDVATVQVEISNPYRTGTHKVEALGQTYYLSPGVAQTLSFSSSSNKKIKGTYQGILSIVITKAERCVIDNDKKSF